MYSHDYQKKYFIYIIIIFLFIARRSSGGGHQQLISISSDNIGYMELYPEGGSLDLYQYDSKNSEIVKFYTISNKICQINEFHLDQSGKKGGIFEWCEVENNKNNKSGGALGYYSISIIDIKAKKEIGNLKNGYVFSFSPYGNTIAFLPDYNCRHEEAGCPIGFESGVWIYDFKSKTKRQIDKGEFYDINWSKHDGNIYVTNWEEVYCYNVKKQKFEKTPYKGIYFSPDGKYYSCNYSCDEEPFSLIVNTEDNQPMKEWNEKLAKLGKPQFTSWADRGNAILLTLSIQNFVFDINKGEVVQKFDGEVIGGNAEGTKFLIKDYNKEKKEYSTKIIDIQTSEKDAKN